MTLIGFFGVLGTALSGHSFALAQLGRGNQWYLIAILEIIAGLALLIYDQ